MGQRRLVSAREMMTSHHLALVLVLALVSRASAEIAEIAENEPIKEVFVTLEDGRTFAIDFEPSEKLFEFRQRIEDLEDIPWQRQKLTLGDRELQDDLGTLSDFNIKSNANLKLTLVAQKAESYVMVRTLAGKEVHVDVDLARPVKRLKEFTTGLLTNFRERYTNLRLIFKGRSLRDDRKLLAYPIGAGTTLLQGKQLEDCRGAAEILVQTLSGATIRCQVDLADTVAELEHSIEEQTGVPREAQVLGYGENRLRSEDHLCDHGLETGASVNLVLYLRQVRAIKDIGQLVSPPMRPYEVPIFREADDDEEANIERRKDVLGDAQNWLFDSKKFADIMDLFNPVAQLELTRQKRRWFDERARDLCNFTAFDFDDDDDMARYQLLSARRRMDTILRQYRIRTTYHNSSMKSYHTHGIQLGTSWQPGKHLSADINNYATNAFSDNEIMDLFEKSETIRQQVADRERTGGGTLSLIKQKELNRELLSGYAKTLRRVPPMLEILSDDFVDRSDCLVCRDLTYDGRGIRLGASWLPGKPLSLDINNFALDVLDDGELMDLFEKYETFRRQLESDAQIGYVKLSLATQKELNRKLLEAYAEALSGLLPVVKIGDSEQVDGIDCPICYDSLATEPAVKLPCGHVLHQDCISGWLRLLCLKNLVASCPCCRHKFIARIKSSKLAIEWPVGILQGQF